MSGRPPIFAADEVARFSRLGHNVIVFGRVLRRMGLGAQPDRLVLLGQALETIGLGSRSDVKAAARAVLVRTPEEARVYDVAFDAFWSEASLDARIGDGDADDGQQEQPGEDAARRPAAEHDVNATQAIRRDTALLRSDGEEHPPGEEHVTAPETDRAFTYSFAEGLYQKEFASLSEDEAARARELARRPVWDLGTRRSRRMRAGRGNGPFDYRRTLRQSLRRGGEVFSLATRTRKRKRRDLVLLCDISGSMDRYSRLLLQFVHTVRHSVGRVEAFVFGTRITRITREIRHRDIREALDEISTSVSDWAGGTRIGESLRAFNLHWANRVLGRGAIVLIISDGWDRGDIDLLAAEMRRLQRSAYRLIWLNPLLGSSRYRPQTVGMQAALPYIDNFLPAHNLKSLMQLAELLRSIEDRRPLRSSARGLRVG